MEKIQPLHCNTRDMIVMTLYFVSSISSIHAFVLFICLSFHLGRRRFPWELESAKQHKMKDKDMDHEAQTSLMKKSVKVNRTALSSGYNGIV